MNKWVKRCIYFVLSILGLVIIVILLLQTQWAKNTIRNKLQAYISKKTNTEFRIASVDYSLFSSVEMDGVLMRDLNNDTLLYGKKISAEIAMLKIISGKYQVNKLELDNIYINLRKKSVDSFYNYQFIIDAFSSEKTEPTPKDTSAIDLALNNVTLSNIRFNMLDSAAGSFVTLSVADFNLSMNSLDLEKNIYDVKKLYTSGLNFKMLTTKASADTAETAAGTALPFILADSLIVKNSSIIYRDEIAKINTDNTIGLLQLAGLTNKDEATVFKADAIRLADADIAFNHALAPAKKTEEKPSATAAANSYGFVINEIDLSNNKITYNNTAAPVTVNGFDYAHVGITGLQLKAMDNYYKNDTIQSDIKYFSFKDKSGFQIDSLSGLVKMDSNKINIQDFVVKTPTSTIRASAMVYPNALMHAGSNGGGYPENKILITNAILSQKDLDLLANGLTAKYKKQMNVLGDLKVSANITGTSKQLLIHELAVRSLKSQSFVLQVSGTAGNIADTKNLTYNLNIKNLTASKALLDPFVNATKKTVQLPPNIAISGLLSGNMNRLQTNLQMISAYGKATAKGSIGNFTNPDKMQYDLVVTTNNLETGKWIYQDSLLGKITGTITAKGVDGFDVKKSSLKTTADIKSFRIQQTDVNNIKLSLQLVKGLADFIASVNDEALQVNVKGDANIKNDYPTIDAFMKLQKADLFALGFATDSMVLSTLAKVDVKNLSPKQLDALVRLDSLLVKSGGQQIFADSAVLAALVRNDSTIITLNSSLADAAVASNLDYTQMPDLLNEVMDKYLPAKNSAPVKKAAPGTIAANLVIKPNDQYNNFVKDFSFDNVAANITVSNTDKDSSIKGNIVAEEIRVGENKVSNLTANIHGGADSLNLTANADTVYTGNILLYDANVVAGYCNQTLSLAVNSKDAKQTEQFALAILAKQNISDGYDIHLSDSLMLNYAKWQVNDGNMIRTAAAGFNVSDFDISNSGQKISIASTSPELNAPVKIAIDDFKLSTITAALNKDSMQVEGLLNADFTASNFNDPIPAVDGTLQVDSIMYQQKSVGNINIKAATSNGNVNVTGKLDGNGNNVDLSGNYNASNIDVKVNLNPFVLASVEPFSQGNLARSSGTISGPLSIAGAADNPQWSGELTFNNVQTVAAQFGTFLKIDGQKIMLQYPTIAFNKFTALDSIGNPLTINGTLTENSNKELVADLTIKASDFNVINNTEEDNKMIYGKAIVAVDAAVKGNVSAPDVSGNVVIKNGTELTYVKQNVVSSLSEREELIEFVDMDTIRNLVDKKTLQEVIASNKNKSSSKASLAYNINLEVEPEATFNVIVDPATSDELQVKGKAQINMGLQPNGDVALTGVYELKGGSYQLNYGPVKRKFLLLDGSTITLSGDAENASANITAAYEISTSPLDLIGNEVGGANSTENAQYKRKVPFEVLLKINGPVSKPQLGFDIVMKEKAEGVSYELANTIKNKLDQLRNDPSAMNKQVFALLALNRFIADQSQDYFGGNGVSNNNLLANESVSGFLNAAVNQIADELIKGVDIDINLKTVDDDPSAVRTDLNIMLGKSFLNDRFNVSFGKNFTVDGNDPSVKGRKGVNRDIQFIPDVNTTYKLSADGRYMLRAYRRTQYEAIMDGYFIETGFAFVFTMDYNKLKELIAKKKKQD